MAHSGSLRTPQTLRIAGIEVDVVPKRMRNTYLRIVPPDGRVRVSCPIGTDARDLARFVESKQAWIAAKQSEVRASPASQAACASMEEQAAWRACVAAQVPPLVAKWEPIMGVEAKTIAYRNMRTRWGSCQPRTAKVCFNTRLALYPPECLEYVVVHELCHLLVSGHGPEFKALMDRFLPEWRHARALLR